MINVIDVNRFIRENDYIGPVTSNQIFLTNSYNFHPHGLMSEDIFGLDGSVDRSRSMSWIELNCNIIHPVLYDIISKKIERRIPKLISGDYTYNIDDEIGLVEPSDNTTGQLTGFTDLYENIDRIKFRNPEEGNRGKLINMLYDNIENNKFFMNQLLVCSPVFREVSIMGEGTSGRVEIVTDELTKLYRRVIELANQVKAVTGPVYDVLSYRMQLLIRDIYELIKNRVAKKSGMIRNQMLGKRVDFSARAVIAPNPQLDIGEIGVPFRIICSIFEPYLIYGLVNSAYSNLIPDEFYAEAKRYLGKESLLDSD